MAEPKYTTTQLSAPSGQGDVMAELEVTLPDGQVGKVPLVVQVDAEGQIVRVLGWNRQNEAVAPTQDSDAIASLDALGARLDRMTELLELILHAVLGKRGR